MRKTLALVAFFAGCNGSSELIPDGGAGGAGGAGGSTSRRVTLTDRTAAGGPTLLWAAFSDGDGPWQAIEGAGPIRTFTPKSSRYGLAFVCDMPPDGASLEVVHATVAELPALTVDCGAPQPMTTHKVSGKLAGLAAGASVAIQGGRTSESFELPQIPPPATAYQATLPEDTYDLGAVAYLGEQPKQLVVRRDVAVTADVVADLDFAAQGVALADQPLSLKEGAGAAGLSVGVHLLTGRAHFWWGDRSGNAPTGYPAPPASSLRPEDLLAVEVSASSGQLPPFDVRGLFVGLRQPKALEVSLPPAFAAELSVPAGSPVRPRATFTAYPNALYYQVVAYQFLAGRSTQVLCIFSAAWLGAGTSYQLPDLTAAPGYRPEFGLQPEMMDVEADAVTSSRDLARTLEDDPASRDGSRLSYARRGDHLSGR